MERKPTNRLRTPPSDQMYIHSRRLFEAVMNPAAGSAGERCRNRIVEWVCAAMLLNFGLTAFLSPLTLELGSFKYMLALGVTSVMFAYANTIVGLVRVLALYFNGYGLPWSARVRALCSIFGAAVFGLMGLSLVYLTKDTLTLSLGAGTHFILAGVELYSCLRAGADVAEKSRRDALLLAIDTMGNRSTLADIVNSDAVAGSTIEAADPRDTTARDT